MVRETRYLYVGNLPDPVTQEQISEHFGRHGKIQCVKLISSQSCENNERSTSTGNAVSPAAAAVVAFMDIKCASRAHESVNVINGAKLFTLYNESSSVATVTAGDVNSALSSLLSSSSSTLPSASSRTLDSCTSSSASASKPGCLSPAAGGASLPPMVQAAVSTAAAAGPPGCLGSTASAPAAVASSHASPAVGASSSRIHSSHGSGSSRGDGTNGPVHDVHESYSSSRRVRSRTSTTPTSPQSAVAAAAHTSGSNSHRHHRTSRQRHHHRHHHGGVSGGAPLSENVTSSGTTASSAAAASMRMVSGSDAWPNNTSCGSRSGSVSPLDTGRSRSQGSSCSGSHGHDYDGNDRRLNAVHSECRGRTAGSDSSGVSSSGSNGGGGGDGGDRKPRGLLVRGFPIRSSDTSIRDGLFHDYKKFGKVLWVTVLGIGDDRQAVVTFKRHEDAVKALDASQEKRFFGAKLLVSIHEGNEVGSVGSTDFRPLEVDVSEYHYKATRTLFVGNLDKTVTRDVLREIFSKFGCIVEVDLKSGQNQPFAFIQFDNIRSVVTALREMDGEHLNGNKLKLGFGKSMTTQCVWLEGIADTVSEKALSQHFDRVGRVLSTYIDRQTGRGLVYFECSEHAEWAVGQMRGQVLKDRRLQVDFASRECEKLFIENLEKSGQLPRLIDRVDDRVSGRGHPAFIDYQSSRTNSRRVIGYADSQRTSGDHYNDYIPCGTRVLPIPQQQRYGSSRGSSSSYLPSVPSSSSGVRPDNGRGSFCDGYEHREGGSSSSRSSVKYYDNRLAAPPINDTSYMPSDTYDPDLKDYSHSHRLADDSLDRRRGYRSTDSPSGGGIHGHTSGLSRYSTDTLPPDDAFVDRQDSKSQSEWDSSMRTAYKSPVVKNDDRCTSRTQRSYSPSDGNENNSSRKSRQTSGRHSLRGRTSKSISPVRRRRSKERKDQSPTTANRDYSSSWQTDNCEPLNSVRRSSIESPDRYSVRSVEHASRTSSVSHAKGHSSSSAVEFSKARTRSGMDDDISPPADRDRSLSRTHRTVAGFEDYNASSANDAADRRRFDKDSSGLSSKSETVRSVVAAALSTGRYKTDYCSSKPTDEPTSLQVTAGLNHIGVLSRISCVDPGADHASCSSTPRSKSPVGSDAEESGSGERAASKGSGDEVASLEKEKSHLLSMLKELEECSSGGSEMDALDDDGRTAQRRILRDEVIELDNDAVPHHHHHHHHHHSLTNATIAGSHLPSVDGAKVNCSDAKYDPLEMEYSPDKSAESKHRTAVRDSSVLKQRRRASLENHVIPSYYVEDDVVDLVSDSSGACDSAPNDSHRRCRQSLDASGSAYNSGGERQSKSKQRSYRNRLSGESADSTNDDSCIPMSPPVSRSSLHQVSGDSVIARFDGGPLNNVSGLQTSTPVNSKSSTSADDHFSSSSTGRFSSGATRKGSSASDHQPCIIPDSPVTAMRGGGIHMPTEPRSQQPSSLTSGSSGRIPIDLQLPRFAADWKLSRQLAVLQSTSSTPVVTSSKPDATAALLTQTVVDVRSKEDLVAPFSPGLLSPPVVINANLPTIKSDSAGSTVSVVAAVSIAHLSPDVAVVKTELSIEPSIITDADSRRTSESESGLAADNVTATAAATTTAAAAAAGPTAVPPSAVEKCDLSSDITVECKKEIDKAIREDLCIGEAVKPAEPTETVKKEEPPSAASDSDMSDMLSPGSPPEGGQSLDDRIRALDERLNIYNQTARQVSIPEVASPSVFDYREKYARRRRLVESGTLGGFNDAQGHSSAAEHSAMVSALLNNSSIFEQDSRRLEQLRGISPASSSLAYPTSSFLATADPSSSSLMVPQSRLSALRTVSVDQPPSLSSVDQFRRSNSTVSRIGQSDLHLTLPTPSGNFTGNWNNTLTGQSKPHVLTDTSSTPATGWSSSWASPRHSVVSTLAAPQTPTSQDVTAVRPPAAFSYSTTGPGVCSTPTGNCPTLAPSDPRRAVRPANFTTATPSGGVRHQDSHSSDTNDAWSLASPLNRRDSISAEPSTPSLCKPKEMVSPPISILKKPALSHKDESLSNNSKSGDGFPASETLVSTGSTNTVAGVKRSADVAFSKDTACPIPSKVSANVAKPLSEKEVDLTGPDRKHTSSAATVKTTADSTKKTTSTSKSSSGASSAKADLKKQDALFSVSSSKVENSKLSTADDSSKTSSSSSAVKSSKPHTTSSSSSTSTSTSSHKAPVLHKDSKASDGTAKNIKVSSGNDSTKAVAASDAGKEASAECDSGKSASTKARVLQSKDHNSSKDSKEKDKTAVKEKSASDEKDKKSSHSAKPSASAADHRHSDKSRDRKLDEGTNAPKQATDATSTKSSSSSSKTVGPVTSKAVSKPVTTKDSTKTADKQPSKTRDADVSAKDVTSGSTAVKTSDNKEKDHKVKKDDSSHVDKPSKVDGSSSKTADDRGNGKPAVKSSSKDNSSRKSNHTESKQTSSTDKMSSSSKQQKNTSNSKEQSKKGSSVDKNKSSKKSSDSSSSRQKPEKRPEERREVKALLQEIPEEFLPPYQSMYDMVKRRSNKEREKEDMLKTMENRAKSLSQIAEANSRRKNKSRTTGSTLRQTGLDLSDEDNSRVDKSRRRSVDSTRTSGNAKQASRRLGSSSDSDLSSDSSSNDSSVPRSHKSKSANNTKSHSNALITSSGSNDSSEDEDDDRFPAKKTQPQSNKAAAGRKTASHAVNQRPTIYTSSSSSDISGDESDSVELNQSKKKKVPTVVNHDSNSKSSSKKLAATASQKKAGPSAKNSSSKKKSNQKESSASSESDSDDDRPSAVDQKNSKPAMKSSKKPAKKTSGKSDFTDEKSGSDSDSEVEKSKQSLKKSAKKTPSKRELLNDKSDSGSDSEIEKTKQNLKKSAKKTPSKRELLNEKSDSGSDSEVEKVKQNLKKPIKKTPAKHDLTDDKSDGGSDAEVEKAKQNLKKPAKKTPVKHDMKKVKSGSDSDSEVEKVKLPASNADKSKSSKDAAKSSHKSADTSSVTPATKGTNAKSQSQPLGKGETTKTLPSKKIKDSISDAVSVKPKTAPVALSASVLNKVSHDSAAKSKDLSQDGEKNVTNKDIETSRQKHADDQTQHTLSSPSRSNHAALQSKSHPDDTPPKSATNEQLKQANRKKSLDSSVKPCAKKYKPDHSRTTVSSNVMDEVSHEEATSSKPDNIFEKMEKQDSIEKLCDRDVEKSSPLPDLIIHKPETLRDRHTSGSKSSELPVFLPADDDQPELAVETPKLAVERLKEESSKVESIDMAVKAIMELTSVVPPVAVPVKEEVTPKQPKPDPDMSVSFIEEPSDAMQSEDADDAGELNAAIESLIEKELEPVAEDSPLLPPNVEMEDATTVRQDLDAAEKGSTSYEAVASKGEDHQKARRSSGGEVVKSVAASEPASDTKKAEAELGPHWLLGSQPQQHNEENVSSFMTRLTKATAGVVDFAALSSASRKSSEESGTKSGEPFGSAAKSAPAPTVSGGGLFSGLINSIPADSSERPCNDTVTGSLTIKTEKETDSHPVVSAAATATEEPQQQPSPVIAQPSPDKKPIELVPVKATPVSDDKQTTAADTRSQPVVIRKQEHANVGLSDDGNNSAQVYEFKDDEEEVKHTLHNRSRKRPGDSDSSETAVDTPEVKKARRRANSATAKTDIGLDVKCNKTPGTPDSASSAPVTVKDEVLLTSAASPTTVGAVETVGTNSWMTNMDNIIAAVARGEFERGDESDYYANASQKPRRRGRRSGVEKKANTTAPAAPVVQTPPPPPVSTVAQNQLQQPSYVISALPTVSHSMPSSFPLDMPSIQRSLAATVTSGKASPQPSFSGLPAQIALPQRLYQPVVVSACGPTQLPPGISAALSPGATLSGAIPANYQLMLQRPVGSDLLQHFPSAVAVGVADIQQSGAGPVLHNKLPSPANPAARLVDMPGATQPLLIAVSRGALSVAATPSPVTPNDFAHPQLRGVVPQTAASAPSSVAGLQTTIDIGQVLASSGYRPPIGIISSVAGPLPVPGSILRPAVDVVVSSGMAPLAVAVTHDVQQLNKVRQSPEIASNLMSQQVGTYSPATYIAQINRPPRPFAPAYSPYGVMISTHDTVQQPPRMSPVQSNLLDALQQPSRLAEQEQLLHKQRPNLPQPPPSPLYGSVRGCVLPTSVAADICPSPIGLGQHRLPFTVVQELRTSARAEPKSVAVPQSTSEPLAAALQSLTAGKPLPGVTEKQSSSTGAGIVSVPDHGGGSVASRMELPRSAPAMLTNSYSGPPGATQMEYLMTPGVVPLVLPAQPLVPQPPPDVGTHRFHPAAAAAAVVVSRPPSVDLSRSGAVGQLTSAQTQLFTGGPPAQPPRVSVTLPPPLPSTSGPPTPSSNTTEQTDQLVVNSKLFTDALQQFPKVWHGHLVLKNDIAIVGMHFVAGNQNLVPASLPPATNPQDPNTFSLPQLRIGQRMRLDPTQLEQVSRRMMNDGDFSLLLAVPSCRDAVESITQIYNLRSGFINYLLQKQAAGIVNIQEAGSNQASYVVHIFPPCQFSEQNLTRFVPDVMQSCGDATTYLMIVITTC